MEQGKKLYASSFNPLLIKTRRPLPKEIAIIGAGTIGPDIGYYLKSALPDIKLYLVDVVEKPLKKAQERLSGYAKKAVDKRKMKEEQAQKVLSNIIYTMDYDKIKDCDLVIEAATENIRYNRKYSQQRYHNHLKYQLNPSRQTVFEDAVPWKDHCHPFFCTCMA